MEQHQYFLAYEGDYLACSFDGCEDNPQIKILLTLCKKSGYTINKVSKSEYAKAHHAE